MIARIAQLCFIPHQGLLCAFLFHPTSNGSFFWWICRYVGYEGRLASHILLSQRPDPKEKQVISLDQDVQLCGCFWWMVAELLCMISLSHVYIFFGMGYISSFSLFFLHALWACGIPSLGMHLSLSLFFISFFYMPFGHVAYLLWVCIFYFIIFILVFIVHILDGYFREKESWYVMEFYFMGG